MENPSNFLRSFASLFEGTEVPDRFATWAGLSTISAMLERRIWIDMNVYTIYPNLYIVFVADSGRMRKSTAIKMTRKLLAATDPGPRIVAQKITPEALIDALRVIRTDNPKKIMQESCGGMVVADELVTFLNRDTYDRGLGSLLIELWDCPDKYEYRTRNRPPEEINYGHLSLLGGTTVHTLRDAIPLQALGDGFSSRVLFIYENRTPKPVPRPSVREGFKGIESRLIKHLQQIAAYEGEVRLTSEAEQFFDSEYERFYYSDFYEDPQLQAYASRRDKHLLKISMCLMAAEGKGMELGVNHLEGAKILLEDIEGNFLEVFDQLSMTESGSQTEEVYRLIFHNPRHTMSRADVLRKVGHKIGAQELGKIMETLMLAGRVKHDTNEGRLVYVALTSDLGASGGQQGTRSVQ